MDVEDIRRSGQAARDAAAITTAIDLSGAVLPVTIGLPGSHVSAVIPRAAAAWHDELAAWRKDTEAHGHALITAADRYRAGDAAAAADIRAIPDPREVL